MKRKSIFLTIAIFVFLCSEFTQNVFGIYVEPVERPYVRVPILILMLFIGSWIEYAYFRSKLNFGDDSKSQYKIFLRINLVTFPLTQILAYFFYVYFSLFFWFYVFLIEIGVVFIERYFFRIELQRVVDVDLSSKFILRMTFAANLISFLVGLLAFYPSFF